MILKKKLFFPEYLVRNDNLTIALIIYFVHQQRHLFYIKLGNTGSGQAGGPLFSTSVWLHPMMVGQRVVPGYSTQGTGGCWMIPDVYLPPLQKERLQPHSLDPLVLMGNRVWLWYSLGCGSLTPSGCCWLITQDECGSLTL